MDNNELEVKELIPEELVQVSGGAGLPETWKETIRKDCTDWKKMGCSRERIIRAYARWTAAYPEIETYINSIWDTL